MQQQTEKVSNWCRVILWDVWRQDHGGVAVDFNTNQYVV